MDTGKHLYQNMKYYYVLHIFQFEQMSIKLCVHYLPVVFTIISNHGFDNSLSIERLGQLCNFLPLNSKRIKLNTMKRSPLRLIKTQCPRRDLKKKVITQANHYHKVQNCHELKSSTLGFLRFCTNQMKFKIWSQRTQKLPLDLIKGSVNFFKFYIFKINASS